MTANFWILHTWMGIMWMTLSSCVRVNNSWDPWNNDYSDLWRPGWLHSVKHFSQWPRVSPDPRDLPKIKSFTGVYLFFFTCKPVVGKFLRMLFPLTQCEYMCGLLSMMLICSLAPKLHIPFCWPNLNIFIPFMSVFALHSWYKHGSKNQNYILNVFMT